MGSNVNRTGETGVNNFGSEMVIVEYRKYSDIDVYFPEYDWVYKSAGYNNFKKGNIKCPYEKRCYDIGYLGEGKYKCKENGKKTRVFSTWYNMLQRCYSEEYHKKKPTYIGCETSKDFYNFQNFGAWDNENYYTIEGEKMCLDKDILVKRNKIYSPETCIFVPNTINVLFTKRDNARGESVIGTHPHRGKYVAECHIINPETGKSKKEYLGIYDTQEKAFKVYKYYKEKNIKMVADYFRTQIPENLYNAMYNYIVEITD